MDNCSYEECEILPILSLNQLLTRNGNEFIYATFKIFLDRAPLTAEYQGYSRQLRSGASKVSVLYAISLLPSTQRHQHRIRNLDKALIRHRRLCHPFWGKIFHFFGLRDLGSSIEMRLGRIEKQLEAAIFQNSHLENISETGISVTISGKKYLMNSTDTTQNSAQHQKPEENINLGLRGAEQKCSTLMLADLLAIASSIEKPKQ